MNMNWSHIITGFLITVPAIAADDSMVRSSLAEIRGAHQQTRYLMQSNLAPSDKERLRYIDQQLMSASTQLQNSLNNPGYPPTYPPPINSGIEIYYSDSCNGDLIGRVNYTTNCAAAFSGERNAWAVKIDGQCLDIKDMASVKACELFKDASTTSGVKIYYNDSCNGDLLAIVNYRTNCQMLSGLPNAWAIESNGQCTDISDMPAVTACERFKQ